MTRPPNYFAASGHLDRAGHRRRDQAWLDETLGAAATRLVVMRASDVAVGPDRRLALVPVWDGLDSATVVFLGVGGDGGSLFAVDGSDPAHADALDDVLFADLRGAAMLLPAEEGHWAAYASAMLTWHRRHRWCGVCGTETVVEWAGHLRRCPGCGAEHFPRTDPVAIVLVTAGDACLLGRQPSWPPQMWSALAGFVEPGESAEDAVRREVMEESGVAVDSVAYHSSQPWPFPMSLMLGFIASAGESPPEVVVDRSELDDARWFGRDELVTAVDDGAVMLPPPFSIARQLVDSWLRN